MLIFKTRRERESIIVQTMIRLYCKENHSSGVVFCDECLSLKVYAEKRLLRCMFGELKPVCKQCPVHCYSPAMREQMRVVMRWAGPRMIYKKPGLAILHILDTMTTKR
jgi:hypothetical protein